MLVTWLWIGNDGSVTLPVSIDTFKGVLLVTYQFPSSIAVVHGKQEMYGKDAHLPMEAG